MTAAERAAWEKGVAAANAAWRRGIDEHEGDFDTVPCCRVSIARVLDRIDGVAGVTIEEARADLSAKGEG